jgi:hypothetical protein
MIFLVGGPMFCLQHVKRWRGPRIFACIWVLFGSLNCEIENAGASSATFAYESAVEYCRGDIARPIALSDDHGILCFDGQIINDQDLSSVKNLKENGLFVVRSPGGSAKTAIALADLLRDRSAIVVVYDYCISACASYLFVTTDQTVVRKSSIVAWHHAYTSYSGLPECFEMRSAGDDGPKMLQSSLCPRVPIEQQMRYAQVEDLSRRFYKERALDPSMFGPGLNWPQSVYVRRVLKNMLDATGVFPDAVWMWNPRFYKNVIKTKVSYEAYPESQAEVDELAARFGFRRVIYDP